MERIDEWVDKSNQQEGKREAKEAEWILNSNSIEPGICNLDRSNGMVINDVFFDSRVCSHRAGLIRKYGVWNSPDPFEHIYALGDMQN